MFCTLQIIREHCIMLLLTKLAEECISIMEGLVVWKGSALVLLQSY